ncbi:hypothetical protein [Nodosilinea nodulosa]|uniref:hypothetical protein n=1 Tax=Nodosilinea nodulosa TaxID=416001 RepID=UPI0002E2AE9B|nr:hypothetical protein [Nodosilinea nodulosa]
MTHRHWKTVNGLLERGHQVASGAASDSPYPGGTIELQTPFFQALGLDLTGYFKGTLNISLSPSTVQLTNPEFTFRGVQWTDRHPPEDFSFSRCRVLFHNAAYNSWIYYPHPETKRRNFQHPSTLEIIAPPIPELGYGCRVAVEYNPLEIAVDSPASP